MLDVECRMRNHCMEERREFERFDLELPAKIETEDSGRKIETFSLKSGNVSSGGAFFPTYEPISVGKQVHLNLILTIEKLKRLFDSQCQIKVTGTVVRSEERGMAVRFNRNYEIMPQKNLLH